MTTLKFSDTHNMVAFLSKPAESEGFEQIVDFLNANPIRYALTINPTIYISCIEQFWSTVKAKTVNGEVQLQALVDGKKIIITESTVRRDLQLEDAEGVDYEVVYKELDNSLVRAVTTASSLEVEQDSGNIIKTRYKATPNKAGSQGTTSGGGPRRQETIRDTTARTRVLDLKTTKTTQANEIASLKRRVKSLEKKKRDKENLGKDTSKQGKINVIDADEDITLVNDQDDVDMFDVNTLAGEEVFVTEQNGNVVEEVVVVIDAASIIPVSAATITDVEVTLAQALAELKSAKPKADKVVIQEPEQGTTTTTPTTIIYVPKPPQDKGKGIMIEEPVVEQVMPMKRLEQIRLDEELSFKLQAKEKEKERLAREKA
ncbi:hypothetical protein Tco_1074625 [Tanacetum coccineum]